MCWPFPFLALKNSNNSKTLFHRELLSHISRELVLLNSSNFTSLFHLLIIVISFGDIHIHLPINQHCDYVETFTGSLRSSPFLCKYPISFICFTISGMRMPLFLSMCCPEWRTRLMCKTSTKYDPANSGECPLPARCRADY